MYYYVDLLDPMDNWLQSDINFYITISVVRGGGTNQKVANMIDNQEPNPYLQTPTWFYCYSHF